MQGNKDVCIYYKFWLLVWNMQMYLCYVLSSVLYIVMWRIRYLNWIPLLLTVISITIYCSTVYLWLTLISKISSYVPNIYHISPMCCYYFKLQFYLFMYEFIFKIIKNIMAGYMFGASMGLTLFQYHHVLRCLPCNKVPLLHMHL